MAFIAVSGEPGCLHEELARLTAQRLESKLVTESTLDQLIAGEFGEPKLGDPKLGDPKPIPERAWQPLAVSLLATLGLDHRHLVVCFAGAEVLARDLPGVFRFHVVAPEKMRLDHLMTESGISRAASKTKLRKMTEAQSQTRKRRFGQKTSPLTAYDLIGNEQALTLEAMVDLLVTAVRFQGLLETGPISAATAAKVQFQVRLQLARYGIAPPDRVHLNRATFGHPSEEVFANLLDFYRIAWDYEPRSFPLQWDKDGKVCEAFTPDFYLPEFDLYVELTTMKQANVTKKNRKIRMLRAIYPHVNIQVFYQKDVQDLVMKYRLPEQLGQ
jgi:cytidylate kinase